MALTTLLHHSHCDRLLKRCEVVFFFIERDELNFTALKEDIKSLGRLPQNVSVHTIGDDCFQALDDMVSYLRSLRSESLKLALAFLFVDPYGFKVPGRVLRELMQFPRVELFINIIWRELYMAIQQRDKPGMAQTLGLVFDGQEWRTRIASSDFGERAEQSVNLLREKVGARWATFIRMLGDNNATRYLLLHLTNHDSGRDLMKDCMWNACPEGGFYVRKWDDASQQFLITPEPDLIPLEAWVINRLSQGPRKWQALVHEVRAEIWREPHLNKVIRELRKQGRIDGDQYQGRFLPSGYPRLFLVESPHGQKTGGESDRARKKSRA